MFDKSSFVKPSDIQHYLPKPIPVEENPIPPVSTGESKGRLFRLKAACNRMLSLFKRYIWEVRITRQLNRNIAVLTNGLKEKHHADLYSLFEGVSQLKDVCVLLKNAKVSPGKLVTAERSLDSIRNKILEGGERIKETVNQTLPEESKATVGEFCQALNDLIPSVMNNSFMNKELSTDDYEMIRKWQETQEPSAEYALAILASLSKVINQCLNKIENQEKNPEITDLVQELTSVIGKFVAICFDVGCYYDFDEKSSISAVSMYRLAAEYGHPEALRNLGYCFETGKGVAVNLEMATKCYNRAASQGDVQAQCNLAYFLETGKWVKQDEKKAVQLYAAAAAAGNARAQCNLGYCYAQGKGVEKDPVQAAALYEMAALQNYPQAQCNLAHCYETGIGVKQDLTKALDLYRRAAEQENVFAKERLEQLLRKD